MYEPSHKDFSCILNILDSIKRIQEYSVAFNDADSFYADTKSFDAALMNFIVIGEMADKLSNNFLMETSSEIDWVKVKSFINILAHNYFGIDAEEVWQIIHSSLFEMKEKLELLLK
jgi:uncharacterized protein with HEPN domain